ncbi:PA3496 family putative envelope integrity protein [Legionella jordanis]|uniref:Uncharacterized protein n=1 Tax=Legionella jordanis TaxID=456 RepID=A0A0W0V809_9GAMM|nr:hypothetical protein [Legionella jordanis]KTD16207.1 hypothetical protein Ljor_0513 [Legionella jordanis]RMX04572.1 hypothetical protein EAW55_03820 [Legionella jordanis]RMX21118.1 hypothetical protein EAS68_05280 [Legionella jordanis]VEH12335.1 Uncharacterised protein [Legionella jordanis]HAT8713542.1 hypothetical protein [Legionella jordanis]
MGFPRENEENSLSDYSYEPEEQIEDLDHKKRVRKMIEDRLERKRLREELEDELNGEFDWEDWDELDR